MLKENFHKLLHTLRLRAPYTLLRTGYLKTYGWFDSFYLRESVDSTREPIAWYTYPAIDFLEPRLTKEMEVFEYGCGNSTKWYAKRVDSVVSVEHDQRWFDNVIKTLPKNATLVRRDLQNQNYALEISRHKKKFDIVAIDGRDRVACTFATPDYLKEDGVLIFDNSDRQQYAEAFTFLMNKGFKRIDFVGIGPINYYQWTTSIIYRVQNCLGI